MSVSMYGPAFDGSGTIVNREVPEADVVAFEQAGYLKGKSPSAPDVKSGQSDSKSRTAASDEDAEETKTKADLSADAESKGIVLKSGMTKAEMQEALDLEGKTKSELIDLALSKGLEVSGNKLDMINQIIAG